MSWPARIYIKLFAREAASSISDSVFIPVFQRWIREDALPGTWIDVADYGHVHHGPGVLLAGHEAHLMTDKADGRLGLCLQARKSQGLKEDLKLLLAAATLLESAAEVEGTLKFSPDQILVGSNDRLFALGAAADQRRWASLVREEMAAAGLKMSPPSAQETSSPSERASVLVSLEGYADIQSLAQSL